MTRKILTALILVFALLITGCSPAKDPNEEFYEAVREVSDGDEALVAGYACVQTLLPMFEIYNNATYQTARSTAKVGIGIEAEWFPTTEWQGVEMLNQQKLATLLETSIVNYTDTTITFVISVLVLEGISGRTNYLYKANYSVASDVITSLEELYKD